ncbi:MAG: hypothetical protein AB7V53_15445 [Dongiaceae bacterium]
MTVEPLEPIVPAEPEILLEDALVETPLGDKAGLVLLPSVPDEETPVPAVPAPTPGDPAPLDGA